MSENLVFLKKFRLLRKHQFQVTLSSPGSLVRGFFVLYQKPNTLGYPRLGIIAYKKKFRTAIIRNFLKRLAREAFRLYRSQLTGYDIVLVARSAAIDANNDELRQCLDHLFLELLMLSKKH